MEKMPFIKSFFQDEKKGKTNLLFICGLIGILLIFASSIIPSKTKSSTSNQDYVAESETKYVDLIEKKLTDLLAKTQGVGDVKIMVTLESSTAYIYAQNEQSDNETQSSDSETPSVKSNYKNEHVIIENSGEKKPLVETSITPEIKGVAVVCKGGGDILVIKRVTDLISALLALPTNRICVTKMI